MAAQGAQQGNPQAEPASKTLIERHFGGIDLSSGITALSDGRFLQLENMMPYAEGHLAVTPGQLFLDSGPSGGT